MSQFAAVIFDLFHTLVDPEDYRPPEFKRVSLVAEALGLDAEELYAFWDETSVERTTTPIRIVELVERFAQQSGRSLIQADHTEIDALMGRYQDLAIRRPRAEVTALVHDLSLRCRLALLSVCHEREVRAWPDSPLAPYFQAVGFSHEIGARKPDAASYRVVLDMLAVPAGDCVFVGNGGSDELAGARAAGFAHVIHCNAFDRTNGLVTAEEQARRAAQAHVSITSFEELAAVLGT